MNKENILDGEMKPIVIGARYCTVRIKNGYVDTTVGIANKIVDKKVQLVDIKRYSALYDADVKLVNGRTKTTLKANTLIKIL